MYLSNADFILPDKLCYLAREMTSKDIASDSKRLILYISDNLKVHKT